MIQQQTILEQTADDRIFLVRFRTRITMLVPVALLLAAWWWGQALSPAVWLGGTACVLLGIALRLWAAGCLRKQEALVCWGPFAYLRNPLYVGTLLIGSGLGLLTGRWEALALVATLMLTVYLPTVRHEERVLRALFGPAYDAYCREVPRWLPRLTPRRSAGFAVVQPRWRLVQHNREHHHLLVQLAFLAAFYAVQLVKG